MTLKNVTLESYVAFFDALRAARVAFKVTSHCGETGSNDSTFIDGRLVAQRTVTYRVGGNLCSWRVEQD